MSTTATTLSAQKQQQREHNRFHRVLAYGDSLTAGTCGFKLFPYAPYLEQAMSDIATVAGRGDGGEVKVHHLGLPGWTTTQMLEHQNSDHAGLIPFIKQYSEPSPSLVILMAGTNDLGDHDEDKTIKNLLEMHQLCYKHGVPRTLAIGIPPSGYQSMVPSAADEAKRINAALDEFAKEEDRATYVEFPFSFVRNGENWSKDTLHFSKKGYQILGRNLAPHVQEILTRLDNSHGKVEASE